MDDKKVESSQGSTGEIYEVILQKEHGSLGLVVAGGIDTKHGGIYAKSFQGIKPAAEDRRIKLGDQILKMNNLSLIGVTHRDAVEMLRSAPQVCKLLLQSRVPTRNLEHATIPKSRSMSPSYGVVGDEYPEMNDEKVENSEGSTGEIYEVILQKKHGSLGLSVIDGLKISPKHGGTYIKRFLNEGRISATGHGRIKPGDVILKVNDLSLIGVTHQEAIEILRSAPQVCKLVLQRDIWRRNLEHSNTATIHQSMWPSSRGIPFAGDDGEEQKHQPIAGGVANGGEINPAGPEGPTLVVSGGSGPPQCVQEIGPGLYSVISNGATNPGYPNQPPVHTSLPPPPVYETDGSSSFSASEVDQPPSYEDALKLPDASQNTATNLAEVTPYLEHPTPSAPYENT